MVLQPIWLQSGGESREEINMQIIPKFNPYNMSDELILKLSTGRDRELKFALETIEGNLKGDQASQHILLHGPRGSGKSFFLRLIQIHLKQNKKIECYLFPEEQNNFFQPADLIKGIKQFILKRSQSDVIAGWISGGRQEWEQQIGELKSTLKDKSGIHFVIGIESFDMLFGSGGAFESRGDQFLLREFLSSTSELTVVATTLYPDLDAQYEKALFHSFAKHELIPWQDKDHQGYLSKKLQIDAVQISPLSRTQLFALTRFTGGSPRITVIISDVLSQGRLESATRNLESTIDILTPFYQDLLARIPTKSRLLFDALIRGGEPCSQSELAKRVGTTQNVISRSFKWLLTHQYLTVDIPEGEKQRLYSVRDRLFVHYYRMRHIHSQTGKSILAIMSEFLTSFYNSRELRKHAEKFYGLGQAEKSRDLLHITMESSGIDAGTLPWKENIQALFQALDLKEAKEVSFPETFEGAKSQLTQMRDMLAASAYGPKDLDKIEFSQLLLGSLRLTFAQKVKIFQKCINNELTENEWLEVLKNFKVERKIISKFGQPFLLLMDAMRNGNIILEFVDETQLDLFKKSDVQLYFTLLAFLDDKITSSTPDILLKSHEFLYKQNQKDKNLFAQASNLDQIGWNLTELERYEEAINSHEKALELRTQEDNITGQAWNLGRIGWNLMKLERYEEAIKSHEKALELRTQEDNITGQAWNLDQIGWNLAELGSYEEAIKSHEKALELRTQEDNISRQAWNLERIGWNLAELGSYEEAIKSHEKALGLWIQEDNINEQAWNLGQVGWNLMKLERYEEAIKSHEKALGLWIQEDNISEQAWNLGQVAANLLLMKKDKQAWEVIDENAENLKESRYAMVKQLGDVVSHYEKKDETAKAFSTGVEIIEKIYERKRTFKISLAFQKFFTDLLYEKVSVMLIEDLYENVVSQYNEDMRLQLNGISGVIEYLKSNKSQNHLIKMPPEKRKVVEELVKELRL
jgi:tetratricopeptide (TPR) repeat protein